MRSQKKFATIQELEVEAIQRVSTECDARPESINIGGFHKRFRTEMSEVMAKVSFGEFEIPTR